MLTSKSRLSALLAVCVALSSVSSLSDTGEGGSEASSKRLPPGSTSERVFWGDLHLHSNLLPDAYLFENRMLGPSEAYQFAAGKSVLSSTGRWAKLDRPLDFLAVTDHAEYMGVFASVSPTKSSSTPSEHVQKLVLSSEVGFRWAHFMKTDQFQEARNEFIANSSSDPAANAVLPELAKRSLICIIS